MKPRPAISVLIPTIDERNSLETTVGLLLSDIGLNITEILLIVCKRTADTTRKTCRDLEEAHGSTVRIVEQYLPHLGGAFRSGIREAAGTHLVLMFADLESDPRTVASMARRADVNPSAIISASRWLSGGGFIGYGIVKRALNYAFQRVCALACQSSLTDFTYGFRLYPSAALRNTEWRETDHAFVVESLLRPMLDGVEIREIPAFWTARREGVRRFRFRQYSHYIPAIVRVLAEHRRRGAVVQPVVKPVPRQTT